jgi:hypothetical protein
MLAQKTQYIEEKTVPEEKTQGRPGKKDPPREERPEGNLDSNLWVGLTFEHHPDALVYQVTER